MKKKISIVDNDVASLRIYNAILQRNYEVKTFRSQADFMRSIVIMDDEQFIPNLIIFEKNINGFDYIGCRYFLGYRDMTQLKDIPKIIVTNGCDFKRCIYHDYSDGCYDKVIALAKDGVLEAIVEKHLMGDKP